MLDSGLATLGEKGSRSCPPFRASLRATAVVPRPMLRLQIDEPPRPATASSTFQHRVGADALLHQTLRRRNRDEQLSATDYLRERRAKERAKEREFEHQLRDEGRARDNRNVACVGEANRWAAELDDPRQVRVAR